MCHLFTGWLFSVVDMIGNSLKWFQARVDRQFLIFIPRKVLKGSLRFFSDFSASVMVVLGLGYLGLVSVLYLFGILWDGPWERGKKRRWVVRRQGDGRVGNEEMSTVVGILRGLPGIFISCRLLLWFLEIMGWKKGADYFLLLFVCFFFCCFFKVHCYQGLVWVSGKILSGVIYHIRDDLFPSEPCQELVQDLF